MVDIIWESGIWEFSYMNDSGGCRFGQILVEVQMRNNYLREFISNIYFQYCYLKIKVLSIRSR